MKTALKIALVTVALMAAQPALAKETVTKDTKETTTTKETTKDGATKTVKHHHHKHTVTTTDNSARRYDHGTFLGYPIQANGNPETLRTSRGIQR